MKKILTVLFCTLWVFASGQHITVSLGVEKTVAGNQYGGSMTFEGKKNWGVGSFFQAGVARDNDEPFLKNPFYGLVWQIPIANSQKISFVGRIKTGLVNHKFFAITPELETKIKIARNAGFIVGAGLRVGYPSLSVKIFMRLS